MSDPFLISGPAVISFSGGATSGYMLWRILQAHGGMLPDDVHVLFQNTGKEHPATLEFVHECSTRWGVHVTWLEYDRENRKPTARVVNHNSASRNGDPFARLIEAKQALPNPVSRFCTVEMKVLTAKRHVINTYGWKRWTNIVGLRADEMRRVERATNPTKPDRWDVVCPLAMAGVTVADVAAFWKNQPFRLRLPGKWAGNCDGCFLKSRAALSRQEADSPGILQWWADQEAKPRGKRARATFRHDREDYATMIKNVHDQGALPFDETMVEGGQECGMECGI